MASSRLPLYMVAKLVFKKVLSKLPLKEELKNYFATVNKTNKNYLFNLHSV